MINILGKERIKKSIICKSRSNMQEIINFNHSESLYYVPENVSGKKQNRQTI